MIIKEFPTLYAKSSTGKTKQWTVSVEEENGSVFMVKQHGYIDGTIQRILKEVKTGKNLGKANATTIEEQALFDSESAWNKKKDSKYSETIEESENSEILLPMLAHSYTKRKHNIVWPTLVQPKLDGIRCLARIKDGKVLLTSRKAKVLDNLDHLVPDIERVFSVLEEGAVLDGELFIYGETFQAITRLVKKKRPETVNIQYWVYDIINDKPFIERDKTLTQLSKLNLQSIVIVKSAEMLDEEALKKYHALTVQAGYEGTIVRNKAGLYRQDYRSADLQKYKDFFEDDYEIIDVNEATGIDAGTAVFVCTNKEGSSFKVRPKGTREQRKEWFDNKNQCINKLLSVRYQMLSEDLIPRFPVGLGIKEDR